MIGAYDKPSYRSNRASLLHDGTPPQRFLGRDLRIEEQIKQEGHSREELRPSWEFRKMRVQLDHDCVEMASPCMKDRNMGRRDSTGIFSSARSSLDNPAHPEDLLIRVASTLSHPIICSLTPARS